MTQLPLFPPHGFSPAQWLAFGPLHEKNMHSPLRDPSCEGCHHFGLCIGHAVGRENIRRHPHSRRVR